MDQIRNPKHEIRNKLEIQNTNDPNPNGRVRNRLLFIRIQVLGIYFGFRASDFVFTLSAREECVPHRFFPHVLSVGSGAG
jgi:hypothetical protein